jgi:dienelactone hydrolase
VAMALAAPSCSSSDGASAVRAGSTVEVASTALPTRAAATVQTTTTAPVADTDGTYAVGIRMVTFVDPTRGTPANGSVPARPTRTLETLIAYPAVGTPDPTAETESAPPAKGSFPLIVYVHGFGGGYESPYLHYWAEAGFVVIAPSFPLTRHDAPGGPSYIDVANEPADVSFVLNQMGHLPAEDADIQQIVNGNEVGIAGASLGAPVALDVGYDSTLEDPRVGAVAAISGASCCPLFGAAGVGRPAGTYFQGPSVPLMLMHGTADPTAPYAKSSEEFGLAPAPKFFVTLEGAPHIRYGPPWEAVAAQSMIDFFDRYLKNDPTALTRLDTDANVDGVASLQEKTSGQ